MYNIYFELAATGFLVILLLYLYIQYPNASESNLRYRQWVTWILISQIMDVVTGRMIDYGYRINTTLNIIANTAYFFTCAGSFWGFARYLHSFVNNKKSRTYMKINTVIITVYVSIMIINVFTGWVFTFDENGAYVHGPIYAACYLIQIVVGVMSAIFLWMNRSQLEGRQTVAIWIFMFLIIAGFFLQGIFFPKTLLTSYMCSIAAMTMLFVIETPDYLKLTQTMEALEEQRKRADVANEAKSSFLANMSHEIRTPMNAIVGMDEMIIREAKEERIRKYARDIKSAGQTLLTVINEILDLSKIESGKMELVPVEYDMASLIKEVADPAGMAAGEKGLTFFINADPDTPAVMFGDEVRIRQIMKNVMDNAIKYTDRGKVETDISFDEEKGELIIVVSDTGSGIKDEDMGKLFQSFHRLDESKHRSDEGTGLGLNITKNLVEMMNGTIDVKSTFGEGSVFTIRVKQTAIGSAALGDISPALSDTEEKESVSDGVFKAPDAKVLIVDDNDMNLDVISGLLESTGIRVFTASSGQECIDLLKENTYHMLFLDQMMPGLSGVQTLEI
nr:response regulator [Lachnospiraceae bacterium]